MTRLMRTFGREPPDWPPRRPIAVDTSYGPSARAPLIGDDGEALGDVVQIVELRAIEGGFVVEPAAIPAGIGRRNHAFMLCGWMIILGLVIGGAVIWSPANGTLDSGLSAGAAGPDPSVALPPPASYPETVATRPSGHSGQGASFVVLLPTATDYLVGPTIAVAGNAFSRPHGVSISSVVIRLVVRGRVVAETVLPVHRGRFAGTLHADTLRERTDAELEVASATWPGEVQVIRHLLVDAYDR